MNKIKEPTKLIKVTLEYGDEIRILKGDEAQKWLDDINSFIMFNYVHGILFPEYNWIVKKK